MSKSEWLSAAVDRLIEMGETTMNSHRALGIVFGVATTFALATLFELPLRAQERPQANALPPTHADVKYGPHKRNLLNFWQAETNQPTPLVIHIHGGGFLSGGPTGPAQLKDYLRAGISVASITYRFSSDAPYPAQMQDSTRAVQFLRSKAKEWNVDAKRFGAMGGSAGAGISLWIGFHDDLADPHSADPIARQSTRLTCMAVNNAQTSYDPRFIAAHIPGPGWKAGPLWMLYGMKAKDASLDDLPPEKVRLFEEASPLNYLTADDPPVRIIFTWDNVTSGVSETHSIHHPKFGEILKQKMDELKIDCEFKYAQPAKEMPEDVSFFKKHFGLN